MDGLRAAVPLARLLLALADHQRTAEIRLRVRGKPITVSLDAGQLVAIRGVDVDSLGDTLLRTGGLNTERHQVAVSRDVPPEGRVGAWLVAVGAASESDVQRALEAQLKARLTYLLRYVAADADIVAREIAGQADRLDTRADLVWAVFSTLRELSHALSERELRELSGTGPLKLTRSGSRLVEALVASAENCEPPDGWLRNAAETSAFGARAVLRVLGAAVEARFEGDVFRLLLRKQREIRRRVGPRALLDLPPHAHFEQARPALRRLATKLHPDRFHGQDPALFAASHEVMRALSEAAGELRAGYARAR